MKGCIVIASLAFGLLITGCGQAPSTKRDPVFPVSGKVVYKGQPVAAADLTFICEEKNRSAFGRTDDQGHFKLTTFASNDGAVAGKHMVTVTKIDQTADVKHPDVTDPAYDPLAVERQAQIQTPPKNQIPKKYADSKTTDLIAVVSPDGNNPEMTLELKD